MHGKARIRLVRRLAVPAAAAVLALVAAACTGSSSSGAIGSGTAVNGHARHGGTVTIGWENATPNFIFPLAPATNSDGYNVNLTEQMWPYLVYSGDGAKSIVNTRESLYTAIKYSDGDRKVTNTSTWVPGSMKPATPTIWSVLSEIARMPSGILVESPSPAPTAESCRSRIGSPAASGYRTVRPTRSSGLVEAPKALTADMPKIEFTRSQYTLDFPGDLAQSLSMGWGNTKYPHNGFRSPQVLQKDGKPLIPGNEAPILLMGDSFSLHFSENACGFLDDLISRLGVPIQVIGTLGGPIDAPRQILARNPAILSAKKVVIWEFAQRYMWRAWGKIDLK